MRVAALYDVHGNLPALEAVLADVECAAPDLIVFGGDVAGGPLPRETLDRIRELEGRARFVRGNGDRTLVERFDGNLPEGDGLAGLSDAWVAEQLTREDRDFLASFVETVSVELDELGPVLFCHASPRDDDELFLETTPDTFVGRLLTGVQERLVVCGHTHMQFDRHVGERRVVNAGSVGMPYGEPGAHWALLGPDVALRRTPYDLDAAAAQIRASSWPGAEEFAADNVLTVPSREEVLEVFEPLVART